MEKLLNVFLFLEAFIARQAKNNADTLLLP